MPRMPFPPVGKSACADQGLLCGPAHEQGHADPRKQPQDVDDPLVADAQKIFRTGAIQPLMPATLDPPIVPLELEEGFGGQFGGRAAGDQVFHFGLGRRAVLPLQTTDLGRARQTQLGRFNRAGRQRAAFLAAAVVLPLDHLRGKRPPAGGLGRRPAGRFGCL